MEFNLKQKKKKENSEKTTVKLKHACKEEKEKKN